MRDAPQAPLAAADGGIAVDDDESEGIRIAQLDAPGRAVHTERLERTVKRGAKMTVQGDKEGGGGAA